MSAGTPGAFPGAGEQPGSPSMRQNPVGPSFPIEPSLAPNAFRASLLKRVETLAEERPATSSDVESELQQLQHDMGALAENDTRRTATLETDMPLPSDYPSDSGTRSCMHYLAKNQKAQDNRLDRTERKIDDLNATMIAFMNKITGFTRGQQAAQTAQATPAQETSAQVTPAQVTPTQAARAASMSIPINFQPSGRRRGDPTLPQQSVQEALYEDDFLPEHTSVRNSVEATDNTATRFYDASPVRRPPHRQPIVPPWRRARNRPLEPESDLERSPSPPPRSLRQASRPLSQRELSQPLSRPERSQALPRTYREPSSHQPRQQPPQWMPPPPGYPNAMPYVSPNAPQQQWYPPYAYGYPGYPPPGPPPFGPPPGYAQPPAGPLPPPAGPPPPPAGPQPPAGSQRPFQREGTSATHNTQRTNASRYPPLEPVAVIAANASADPTARGSTRDKLKPREQIGIFDPSYEDKEGLGLVFSGKDTIYTDINCFEECVLGILNDPRAPRDRQHEMLSVISQTFSGSCLRYWHGELTHADRQALLDAGMEAVMNALKERFAIERSIALKAYSETEISLRKLYRDNEALNNFFQKKIRWVRAMNLIAADNNNWDGALHQIWGSMPLEFRQNIKPPDEFDTLPDYMKHVNKTRGTLITMAEEAHGRAKFLGNTYGSSSQRPDSQRFDPRRSDIRRSDPRRSDKDRRNDRDRRGDRSNDRDKPYDKSKSNDKSKLRYDPKKDSRDKAHNVLPQEDSNPPSPRQRADFISSGTSHSHDSPSPRSDHSYYEDSNNVMPCGDRYEVPVSSALRSTCDACGTAFPTRNALFRHLGASRKCPADTIPAPRHPKEPITYTEDDVIVETPPEAADAITFGGYTHLRVNVRGAILDEDVELCVDTGTGRSIVA